MDTRATYGTNDHQILWAKDGYLSKLADPSYTTGKRVDSTTSSQDYKPYRYYYDGQHSHGISEPNSGTGHSHSITQNNHTHTINSDGISESRPDNFTYKIWKRIL